MFCPNCGTTNSTEQKFCRSCGINLGVIAESLLLQLTTARDASSSKKERSIENLGNFVFSRVGLIVLIGVILMTSGIFFKVILADGAIVSGTLMIFCAVLAGLMAILISFYESVKERKAQINPALTSELTQTKDTGKLLEEKPFEPVSTVTENSTELLPVENKTRKFK